MANQHVFNNGDGAGRILRGVAVSSASTRLAEMAGRLGFDAVWIEMEHGPVDFSQVEALCVAAEVGGAVPVVRVPDGQRHHVLRALEVGAGIVVVPMINTRQQAQQLVEYGKFPPLGSRGFNLRSRGLGYGLSGREASFEEANEHTHLFAQIETSEAVLNVDQICDIEGLSGILVGPGDLSSAYGRPGDFDDPKLIRDACRCIRTARACGKHAGIVTGPGKLLDAALEAGCDLAFVGSDAGTLAIAWAHLLESVTVPIERDAATPML